MTTSEWENEKKTNPNEYSHEPEVQMTDNIRLHCYFANLMLLIDFFFLYRSLTLLFSLIQQNW